MKVNFKYSQNISLCNPCPVTARVKLTCSELLVRIRLGLELWAGLELISKPGLCVGLPPVRICAMLSRPRLTSPEDQPRDAKCPGFQGAVKITTTIIITIVIIGVIVLI